ncbi:MAG: hypothetical protein ACI8ZB_004295 [Desulforhopalus sp.]|jgi:hypothetical protein
MFVVPEDNRIRFKTWKKWPSDRKNRKNNAKEIKHGKGKIPDQIGMP